MIKSNLLTTKNKIDCEFDKDSYSRKYTISITSYFKIIHFYTERILLLIRLQNLFIIDMTIHLFENSFAKYLLRVLGETIYFDNFKMIK